MDVQHPIAPPKKCDEEPFLASDAVALHLDTSAGQLGSRKPKEVAENKQRVQAQDFLSWRIKADIVSLYQGTFKNKPACLLVLDVQFAFPRAIGSGSRITEAKVVATFRPHRSDEADADIDPDEYPVVRMLCPKLIEGPVRTAKHASGLEVTASIGGPDIIPVKPEASVSRSWATESKRDYKMQISGASWPSKEIEDEDIDNQVSWTVLENAALADGVPVNFRGAVVLEHRGAPVCGTIKISAKTDMGLRLFGWPWSDARPFVLQPSVVYGPPPPSGDMSILGDEYWAKTCKFNGEVVMARWTDM